MPNYWNIYQTELKRSVEDYNESKARESWKKSKKYAITNELDILKESKDPYIGIAYSVRKAEKTNLISEKNKKRERVNKVTTRGINFTTITKIRIDAELKEVIEAYKGNIKKLLRISEEDRQKKIKIEMKHLRRRKTHS